jgi:serine protease Do
LASLIASIPVGKKTRIALMREGKKKNISVKISKQSDEKVQMAGKKSDNEDLGLRVAELSSERARQFGLDAEESGVLVIEVAPESRADKAGVRVGDVIKGVNLKKVNNIKDYNALLNRVDKDDALNLLVRRRNQGSRGIRIEPN